MEQGDGPHCETGAERLDPFGSVATIASSGATKARLQQIRQLSGMRGLMASPSGAVIKTPVRGNFLEGLNMAEHFLSSHSARKSMVDRAHDSIREKPSAKSCTHLFRSIRDN